MNASTVAQSEIKVSNPFQDWFRGSKAVNDHGRARAVYHGTASKEPLTYFDPERQGQNGGVKGAFFFTSDEQIAREVYAWRGSHHVSKVFLRILNPLLLENYFEKTGKDADEEMQYGSLDPTNYFDDHAEAIFAYAHANGHDGLIFEDDSGHKGANDLYAVFSADQIYNAE